MSKLDAQRAMREAKYARQQAAAAQRSRKPVSPVPVAPPARDSDPVEPAVASTPEDVNGLLESLCGHRNMSGRTCTREAGHSAKSHRYS